MTTSSRQNDAPDLIAQIVEAVKTLSVERQNELLKQIKDWQAKKERHPRKPCMIPVDYATKDRRFTDFIQDISASGVFIETKEPFSVGQEITLAFSVPESEIPFKIFGEIVRAGSQGIAVTFKENSPYREGIFKSVVGKMAGDMKK